MTVERANAVWDTLIREAGATTAESRRQEFVHLHTIENCTEYRFIGALGFGGKYRSKKNKIDCYAEDETPERLATVERTNKVLAELGDD